MIKLRNRIKEQAQLPDTWHAPSQWRQGPYMKRMQVTEYDWDYSVIRPPVAFWRGESFIGPEGLVNGLDGYINRVRIRFNPHAMDDGWPVEPIAGRRNSLVGSIELGMNHPAIRGDKWTNVDGESLKSIVNARIKEKLKDCRLSTPLEFYEDTDGSNRWVFFSRHITKSNIPAHQEVFSTYHAIASGILPHHTHQHPTKVTQESFVRVGASWVSYGEYAYAKFQQTQLALS